MKVLCYKYNISPISTHRTFPVSQKIPVAFYCVSSPNFPLEENIFLILLVITLLFFFNSFTAHGHIPNIYVCS